MWGVGGGLGYTATDRWLEREGVDLARDPEVVVREWDKGVPYDRFIAVQNGRHFTLEGDYPSPGFLESAGYVLLSKTIQGRRQGIGEIVWAKQISPEEFRKVVGRRDVFVEIGEDVIKIHVPKEKMGRWIGKGGSRVKALERVVGRRIKVVGDVIVAKVCPDYIWEEVMKKAGCDAPLFEWEGEWWCKEDHVENSISTWTSSRRWYNNDRRIKMRSFLMGEVVE